LGEISSRSFNKAGAVTSGDVGGHGHRNFRTLPESGEGLSHVLKAKKKSGKKRR
jgi:hypothetical protein